MIGVDRDALGFEFPEDGLFIQTDISKPENVAELFSQVADMYGRLDALVNNAAIQIAKPLIETTLEEWDSLMAINLRAVFYSVKQAYPLLKSGQRRDRECLFGACGGDLGGYCQLCGQQGRADGADPGHGNRVCQPTMCG